MSKVDNWERGAVTAVALTAGTVTATLISGPQVTCPYIGTPPRVGGTSWFVEIAPGAYLCQGAVGADTIHGSFHTASTGLAVPSARTLAANAAAQTVTSGLLPTFVKQYDSSVLHFELMQTCYIDVNPGYQWQLGVRVNAIDYWCAGLYFNNAATHVVVSGSANSAAGPTIPAATYSFAVRAISSIVAVSNFKTDGNDLFSLSITECWDAA